MGVKNGLIFGGINSLDYGIYISGDAVFNAPDRKVELIQIPGRNGDFAIDHGRFENIEVSYPAGTFGDDQKDFRKKLSDFRNAILSQVGYQRLSDTYHPDEYRLGVYMSGLDVDPAHYNTAGEFILTFNCKPQRWLTSGETAVTIGEWGETETVSGEVVEIEATEADAVKSLVADIVPIQSGSGTPSPDNIRPISGHDDVTVTVADDVDNPTVSETYTTTLPSTTYGGTLDVVSGELTVTHAIVAINDLNVNTTTTPNLYRMYVAAKANGVDNFISSAFHQSADPANPQNGEAYGISDSPNIYVKATDCATATDFKNTYGTQTFCYELATPTTYQLTPQQIELLIGTNNIWADSGNVTLEYGQNPMVLVNPTLFDASPLLAVKGYGNITFNGYSIYIENAVLGDVIIADGDSFTETKTYTIPSGVYNNSDEIDVNIGAFKYGRFAWGRVGSYQFNGPVTASTSDSNLLFTTYAEVGVQTASVVNSDVETQVDTITFTAGTSSTVTNSGVVTYTCPTTGGTVTCTCTLSETVSYNASDETITILVTRTLASSDTTKVKPTSVAPTKATAEKVGVVLHSTKSALGNPTYIDCEIGECYMVNGGDIVSLNGVIDLGSDLPVLAPGVNTFIYDNTVTELKVTPRWWKV